MPTATTLRINATRKAIAQAVALNASNECGRIVTVSEVFHFVIDKYLNAETAQDMIREFKAREEAKTK
ncbi:hypothetical protein [Gallibacterium anatis]|uniref:hypothetical protein n=1 Tax=Gallibacterium anatis TaxID=750 RepID=UPI0030051515